MNKILRVLLFYIALTGLWQLLSELHLWPEFLFPSPWGIIRCLIAGFIDKTFIIAIAISLKRIAIGYFLSLALGITTGLLLSQIKWLDEIAGPLILGMRTLPSICWLPLGLLWFGLNEKTILFVVIIGSTFSIAVSTEDGIKNIPPLYLKVSSTMGATGIRRYFTVILPAAFPSILTGMKLGWSFAWRSLMAGEMLFVSLGLGHILMMGRALNDITQVVAVMIVIIAIGIVVDRLLLGALEKRVQTIRGL